MANGFSGPLGLDLIQVQYCASTDTRQCPAVEPEEVLGRGLYAEIDSVEWAASGIV